MLIYLRLHLFMICNIFPNAISLFTFFLPPIFLVSSTRIFLLPATTMFCIMHCYCYCYYCCCCVCQLEVDRLFWPSVGITLFSQRTSWNSNSKRNRRSIMSPVIIILPLEHSVNIVADNKKVVGRCTTVSYPVISFEVSVYT